MAPSPAIFAIFAWLVPHVSITIGYYRDAVIHGEEEECWKQKGLAAEQAALLVVRNWAFFAIVLALFFISMAAVAIGLTTQHLDDRMYAVLQGLSRLLGAVYLFLISVFMPRWCNVYSFQRWAHAGNIEVGRSLKALRFNVVWEILHLFGRNCVFLLPLFCGVSPSGIHALIGAGLAFGFFLDFCVYKFQRMTVELRKQRVAFWTGIVIALFASWLFSDGCWYIVSVWGQDAPVDSRYLMVWSSFFGAFIFGIAVHVLLRRQAKVLRGSEENPLQEFGTSRPHMAMSMMVEKLSKTATLVVSEESLDAATDATDAVALASTEDNSAPEENMNPSMDDTTVDEDEEEEDPSNCALLKTKVSCCGCIRGSDKTRKQKGMSCFGWFGWTALASLSMVIVMVNIGATVQGDGVRGNLPLVNEILYNNMDAGPVCAFEGGLEGIGLSITAASTITTFSDKDAAHAAGFLVLHCGACSACSDWYNIRLEYTTRNYLASAGAKCGRKSIFGGRSAVQKCIEAPPIEFRGKCAECWTTDILCTKANCTWIYLQSILIDAAGDFAVGPDTVTAASCEEAFCEVGQFVPCSGATRRRMNVKSSIERPGEQSCGIVDVDWAEVYPGE